MVRSWTSKWWGRLLYSDRGQTTAEYALVLLAAAAVALVLFQWATGGSALRDFFDEIMRRLLARSPQ